MGHSTDYVKKTFEPQKRRSLKHALAQRMGEEFPRLGGPRMLELCAGLVLEVVEQFNRDTQTLSHGQALWSAISIDHPPARNRQTRNEHLVAVVLTLSHPDDIDARIQRRGALALLTQRCVRLCREAHNQGALLSNSDLAELLNISPSYVAKALTTYEKENETLVPRRATLHDVGTGLTHKRIIIRKRYLEGKSPNEIAKETFHSLEAVDRYLGMFDRVRHCLQQNMTLEATAHILTCSLSLVTEYYEIDQLLKTAVSKT